MIPLSIIESKYYNLVQDKISITEFEKWVYESNWLQNELTEEEYTELISLDYRIASAKYEVGKILKQRIDEGRLESARMIELLDSIIERDGKEGEVLMSMYNLYCKGYYFLEDLGLGIGLQIEAPNQYEAECYNELNENQKKQLVDSYYPSAKDLASELKHWILNGDLKLTGKKTDNSSHWQYIDNRNEEDKKSRV